MCQVQFRAHLEKMPGDRNYMTAAALQGQQQGAGADHPFDFLLTLLTR